MNLIISNHSLLPEVSKVINLSNIVYIYVNLLNKIGNINLGENNTLNLQHFAKAIQSTQKSLFV